MAERDELVGRLESLGAARPPALSVDRLAAIERRVVAGGPDVAPPESRRRPLAMLAAAAALVALLVGVVLVAARDADPARMAVAEGLVTLELPDGRTVPAVAGDELADGTIIDVAPGGRAIVADVTLGPGRYEVRDGRPVDATTARPHTTDGPSPATTDVRPDRTTTTERRRPDSPTITVARDVDRDRRLVPSATDVARPSTTTSSTVPTRPRNTTTTAATTAPAPTTTGPTTTVAPDRPTSTAPRDGATTTTTDRRDG